MIAKGDSGIPVALQLYTVREEAARDFTGTLKAVAAVGYTAVELGDFGDFTAAALRDVLDGLGLAALASHVGLPDLRSALDSAIDGCMALGCRYLVCPSQPEEERGNVDAYRRLAAELTTIGQRCRERGLGFAYHNHDFEFERFDGRYGLDVLLEGADAQAVKLELDVYWTCYAGAEPASFLRHLGSRCAILHLKDMTKDDSRTFAEVGEGRLDFPSIFTAAREAGVEFYVVEQDQCQRPPLESIAISLKNLRSWGIM